MALQMEAPMAAAAHSPSHSGTQQQQQQQQLSLPWQSLARHPLLPRSLAKLPPLPSLGTRRGLLLAAFLLLLATAGVLFALQAEVLYGWEWGSIFATQGGAFVRSLGGSGSLKDDVAHCNSSSSQKESYSPGANGNPVALAEATYQRNLDRRSRVLKRRRIKLVKPFKGLNRKTMEEIFLLPLFPCPREQRLGFWGEGGKWVCEINGPLNSSSIVYSIGSNGQVDFEADIFREYNASIFTFDHTLHEGQLANVRRQPYINFYPIGLAKAIRQARGVPRLMDLKSLMSHVGHNFVDVFKIDCEGCEYELVSFMTEEYTRDGPPFGQILMEVHGIYLIPKIMKLLLALEDLGYRMFHAEPNALYKNGYEIAYIHESQVPFL